jgi:hypothetical protein
MLLAQQNQVEIPTITNIDLAALSNQAIHKFWLQLGTDAFNKPTTIPLLIAKGNTDGPVLLLTAAIHGNELNGIAIIQQLFKELDVSKLKGSIIAVPGLNPEAIFRDQRRFVDQEDLNRGFPGNQQGNRSQQMIYQIDQKLLKGIDYHIDLHTASFGRINSLYVRAALANDTLANMAKLIAPDIILNNGGTPSFGGGKSATLRGEALQKGIYSITVEYGDPQVYQPEMTARGTKGIANVMNWLQITEGIVKEVKVENICSKSYWIFTDQGGLLEVPVNLNEKVSKGQLIGILKNPFGDTIAKYHAPEAGIVIGKSTNPVNMSGGRIIHLGILNKNNK